MNIRQQLTETERCTIFAALVEVQDAGATVRDSRFTVAARYKVDVDEVRRIEQEGLHKEWPLPALHPVRSGDQSSLPEPHR